MNTLTNLKQQLTGKTIAGIILLFIGSLFLAQNFGFSFPSWLNAGPIIVLALGIFSGIKNDFKRPLAYILIFMGSFFLIQDIFSSAGVFIPSFPFVLIGVGLYMILKQYLRSKVVVH